MHIKIVFYSKDWPIIANIINQKYGAYRFLYLQMPDLRKKKTELWFKYIGDMDKFDEMILWLNQEGIIVSKKKGSI